MQRVLSSNGSRTTEVTIGDWLTVLVSPGCKQQNHGNVMVTNKTTVVISKTRQWGGK